MASHIRHRGFMLLEIVIAVGLLVLGLAVIGSQIQDSAFRTHETDHLAEIVFLAESKLAELDSGVIVPEQELEQEFGRLFPAYGCRWTMEPAGDPGTAPVDPASTGFFANSLIFIRLDILYDPTRRIEEDFDFDNAEVVKSYYTLRAPPRRLDLTVDFGLEGEVAEKMNQDLAGLTEEKIDVHDFDPATFKNLSIEEIAAVLPTFMQAMGLSESQVLSMVPEQFRSQLEALFAAQATGDDSQGGDDGSGSGGDGTQGGAGGDASGRDQGREPDVGGRDRGEGSDVNSDEDAGVDEGAGVDDQGEDPGKDEGDQSGRRGGRGGGRGGSGMRGGGPRR